jgi:hypothetical protein
MRRLAVEVIGRSKPDDRKHKKWLNAATQSMEVNVRYELLHLRLSRLFASPRVYSAMHFHFVQA